MFATAVRFMAKKAKGRKWVDKPAGMNVGLEGETWSGKLREIVKENGPLTVSSFWEHLKDTGLRSKRHMKIILKWMRGQNHVKLICNHIGDKRSPTDKEFLYAYVVPKSERQAMAATAGNEAFEDQGLRDIPALAEETQSSALDQK
ncbi:hypothetical protein R1sor_002887 [Riccia sorocarpa]|uniref:Uncharacterized protein n=1 Tax=Riccia sorocarpa TaxID=122646 RepID=A0ABD3H3G1_9MARC